MIIGFFFTRNGIVFISGVTNSEGRRVFRLGLDGESMAEWKKKLKPFKERKFCLTQRLTNASSPRVAFQMFGHVGEESHLVIFSGDPGKKLIELLLKLNPPDSPTGDLLNLGCDGHIVLLR